MDYLQRLIGELEVHSIEGIKECFAHGVDPNGLYHDVPLIYELTSEYLRGPRFKQCVQIFVDFGLHLEDKAFLAVLLDDSVGLSEQFIRNPELVNKRYNLRCAFTPMHEATLLHLCAEFNHVACARVLLEHGANINAPAGMDEEGLGGQTPIFHTVNQILNQSEDMLHFLIERGSDLQYTVRGLVWGKGYPWETLIPSVNPISYAMMGMLPQMHRKEDQIADIVSLLLHAAYGFRFKQRNIPNKYLLH